MVSKQFNEKLLEHERAMRGKAEQRGLIQTVQRFSPEHFEWLAMFHFGNQSLESIKKTVYKDKAAISHGMHSAAKLARIKIRITRHKLQNP